MLTRAQSRQQRLAAKTLGIVYLVKQHALRRELGRANDRVAELAQEVAQAPLLRATIEEQNEQLRQEAQDALAQVEPLKEERQRERLELRQARNPAGCCTMPHRPPSCTPV